MTAKDARRRSDHYRDVMNRIRSTSEEGGTETEYRLESYMAGKLTKMHYKVSIVRGFLYKIKW